MRSGNRWFYSLALVVAGLVVGGNVSAEQGCGDGYVPTTTPAGVQCMPIPGLYRETPGSDSPPPAPPIRWASRWGAIAMDNASGKTAIVGSMSSQKKAEKAAVAQCKSKGGGDCQVKISYANQCGVLAWGNNRMVTANGTSLEEASEKGLNQCRQEAGTECEIFFSDCSLPVRIQ
ncbi:DUF4189 domain-containing protein [Lysobacter sp. K5869]|uniref:DUF4189 domain-containing protein n=1 Tax=Lysobacter sp. K5869 TaxID=2820808 RepID=UPI001C060C46|nr:DUF4189 domain-containing protein [Lysobacter sp. K5869]QWP75105.1 DUF4189 domain-containing protein [Lysobacter sp. K5869]